MDFNFVDMKHFYFLFQCINMFLIIVFYIYIFKVRAMRIIQIIKKHLLKPVVPIIKINGDVNAKEYL